MKLIKSPLIEKEYWLASEEVDEFEKDGLPIFTPNDVRELKLYKPSRDEMLKIWVAKGLGKQSVSNLIFEIRNEKPESYIDAYKKPDKSLKNELALKYTSEILKTLTRSQPNDESEKINPFLSESENT